MTTPREDAHQHVQRFDGDDPYLVCDCGMRWDALTGKPFGVPMSTPREDAIAALRPRRAGRRVLTFDNGRFEEYEAVAVWHEPSGGMWDRILIARDDGTLADAIVAALGAEAEAPDSASTRRYLDLASPETAEALARAIEDMLQVTGRVEREDAPALLAAMRETGR